MADFTNRNADETKQFILTFDENGGSPEYTKIEDANGVDRTAEVVELLGINDKEDADSTILKEGDVEDSLNSTSTTKPLSANQGKQLNDDKASLSAINNDPNFYEEGTWTPEYTSENGDFDTLDYAVQNGTYVKVGRLITCHIELFGRYTSIGDAGGHVRVGGLPFTINGTSFMASADLTRWNVTNIFGLGMSGIDGTTLMVVNKLDPTSGNSTSFFNVTEMRTDGTPRNKIFGTITYLTS